MDTSHSLPRATVSLTSPPFTCGTLKITASAIKLFSSYKAHQETFNSLRGTKACSSDIACPVAGQVISDISNLIPLGLRPSLISAVKQSSLHVTGTARWQRRKKDHELERQPAEILSFLGKQGSSARASASKTSLKVTQLICHIPAADRWELKQDVSDPTPVKRFAFI